MAERFVDFTEVIESEQEDRPGVRIAGGLVELSRKLGSVLEVSEPSWVARYSRSCTSASRCAIEVAVLEGDLRLIDERCGTTACRRRRIAGRRRAGLGHDQHIRAAPVTGRSRRTARYGGLVRSDALCVGRRFDDKLDQTSCVGTEKHQDRGRASSTAAHHATIWSCDTSTTARRSSRCRLRSLGHDGRHEDRGRCFSPEALAHRVG